MCEKCHAYQHGIAHRCPPTRIHTCAHKMWVCGSVATGGLTWPEMNCELPDADDVGIQPLDELELPADDLGAIGSNPATAQPCRGKKRQKALLSKNVILLFFSLRKSRESRLPTSSAPCNSHVAKKCIASSHGGQPV